MHVNPQSIGWDLLKSMKKKKKTPQFLINCLTHVITLFLNLKTQHSNGTIAHVPVFPHGTIIVCDALTVLCSLRANNDLSQTFKQSSIIGYLHYFLIF